MSSGQQDFWRLPLQELPDEEPPETVVQTPPPAKVEPAEIVEPGPAGLLREIKEGRRLPTKENTPNGNQKKEWLPKAEYEAKRREERAQAHAQRDDRGNNGQNQRGWRGKGWRDFVTDIPKRPEPPPSAVDRQAEAERDRQSLAIRDQLRSASSAAEVNAAIEAAEKLGMTAEVQMGRKKLAKMT
mmetsp:Transcript_122803/g.191722  ORF Transcript_122803/g.191722 Transcript_122803/m.191722 type:complete len:185 (-) Transcript_122803:195-749(-)